MMWHLQFIIRIVSWLEEHTQSYNFSISSCTIYCCVNELMIVLRRLILCYLSSTCFGYLIYSSFFLTCQTAEFLKWTWPSQIFWKRPLSLLGTSRLKLKVSLTANRIEPSQTVQNAQAGLVLYWWQRLITFDSRRLRGKRTIIAFQIFPFLESPSNNFDIICKNEIRRLFNYINLYVNERGW
jgi:hypothetical protein